MKSKLLFIITLITVFISFIIIYVKIADFSPEDKEDKLLRKITELELKIDSLNNRKDSIRAAIDSTHIKIITNEKHYQERVNTIITQPDSFSESFTRQYLRNYASTRGYRIVGTPETE